MTAHVSAFLSLQTLLHFALLFLSFMFKTMPYFSCSLAYIPSLAQTADNHILLPSFPGRGKSRHTLLRAPRSYQGKATVAGSLCMHTNAAQGGQATGTTQGMQTHAPAPCSTQGFLLFHSSWCISPLPHLVISPRTPFRPPRLSSASFCNACNRLQWQWLQPAGVCKAEDPLNRCKSQAS